MLGYWTIAKGFLGKLPWRLIGVLATSVALAYLIVSGIKAFDRWEDGIRQDAFIAGRDEARAAFEQTRAEESRQALERFAQQVANNNTAVRAYLADIAARKPIVVQTTKEIERYANTAPGGSVCLDVDGVRILRQARAAASTTPGSAATHSGP